MRLLVVCAVSLAVVSGLASAADSRGVQWHANAQDFQAWMSSFGNALTGEENMVEFRAKLIKQVLDFGSHFLNEESNMGVLARAMSKHFTENPNPSIAEFREVVQKLLTSKNAEDVTVGGVPTLSDDPYSYFGWIPPYAASAIPDAPASTFSTPCWTLNKFSAQTNSNGSVTFVLSTSGQKQLLCSDHYMFATVETLQLGVEIGTEGDHTWLWEASASRSTAEAWDLKTKGIRAFMFTNGTIESILQIIDTALLFVPELVNPVDNASAARNLYFMDQYAQVDMKPRSASIVNIDESTVQSGDFFGIIRLDGLDPMLAWAMGSSTGHTAIAIRDPDGTLYVAESTVKDVYWPVNGIQRTPFQLWVQQAANASYQVVHAPLTAAAAAKFNATAALRFFQSVEGVDYGYYNMLWGWVDTVHDNYPCVPPDFSSKCLQWEHVEVLFPIVNKIVPSIGNMLFTQAWNLRMGTSGLDPATLFYLAAQQGMDAKVLPTLVEEDSWMYNTTRYGVATKAPSKVCCAFVCHMWKACGMYTDLNDEVQCGEQTNLDDYHLNMLLANPPRPAVCQTADPTNPLCQLTGEYTLVLNHYAEVTPYANMSQSCPSLPPKYLRPDGC